MELFKWASDKTINVDSFGLDSNRVFVQKAIECYLKNDLKKAYHFLGSSGLTENEILYFAIREYVGDEREQHRCLLFLKKYFKSVN